MNIALIGYGRMGKAIEAAGKTKGHRFPVIIDEHNPEEFTRKKLQEADLAIEFSIPSAAPDNILRCIEYGIPVVSGTTGWNKELGKVAEICREQGGALFYASNFSIGVNILFAMNRKLASIMNRFPQYRATLKEVHHIHKADAPSGTAITLAEQILEEQGQLDHYTLEPEVDPGSLYIEAKREGEVKGFHSVIYDSEQDTLTLSHNAKTRDAFVSGALMAAEFLAGKKGVFGMGDLLNL